MPHDAILTEAKARGLDTEKRKFSILYPEMPGNRFPLALEIENRSKLEQWLRATKRPIPFTNEIWSNERFLGFEMVFFVMRKKR